jgi:hypothetical protein
LVLSLALRRLRSSRTWGALLLSDRCHFRFSFRDVSVLDPTRLSSRVGFIIYPYGVFLRYRFAHFMIYAPSTYESISDRDAYLPKLRPA